MIEQFYLTKIDGTLTDTITQGQSEPGSNDIHKSSKTEASQSDAVKCHTQDTRWLLKRVLPLCRGAVNVFCNPSR